MPTSSGRERADEQGRQLRAVRGEFVALSALMISLVALSIDTMLPALTTMGEELGAPRANDASLIISVLFLGMALGQMLYGPLSDSIGRKAAIGLGLALFALGCILSLLATTFQAMLLGRLLQGLGVAGPRVVTIAMVRDQYEGRAMARIMSLIMAVFILVPVIAPALGQGLLLLGHWRLIFGVLFSVGLIALAWLQLRQPETLPPTRRRSFTYKVIESGIVETCRNRITIGYTIAAGLIVGAFLGYLNSAAPIFQAQYGLGAMFPLVFAVLALAIGGASLTNARLVMAHGMRRLSSGALQVLTGISILFFLVTEIAHGHPPLPALMVYLMAAFFCIGLLFGNFNALAIEPLGHIAGVAAGVVGTCTTLLSVLLGTLIGLCYDGTVSPLVGGFALLGMLSLLATRWAERDRSSRT